MGMGKLQNCRVGGGTGQVLPLKKWGVERFSALLSVGGGGGIKRFGEVLTFMLEAIMKGWGGGHYNKFPGGGASIV